MQQASGSPGEPQFRWQGENSECARLSHALDEELVFESLVHATGKKLKPNRTEPQSSHFTVVVASDFAGDRLQF
jgi:hypothetical protein